MPAADQLDVEWARSHFPALRNSVYLDNAGGSQCLKSVAEAITDYLLSTNVQLGADYSISKESTRRVIVEGPTAIAKLINAKDVNEIVLGPNTTQLALNLSHGLEPLFKPTDEIILSQADHEANLGGWVRLAKAVGCTVKWWKVRIPPSDKGLSLAAYLDVEDLLPLLSPNTRLVAFTATSNILGNHTDVKKAVQLIKGRGGSASRPPFVCVDCVAYAPHSQVDVQSFGADFVLFSLYKVYGPHISCLYTEQSALAQLKSLAHYFLPTTGPYKLQPGAPNYELSYACTAVLQYILDVAKHCGKEGATTQESIQNAFQAMHEYEERLVQPLVDFLLSKWDKGVRIVGPQTHIGRAATIAFAVIDTEASKPGQIAKRLSSKSIVQKIDESGDIFIRYGSFYAVRLIEGLGIDADDGIVRISAVHYNTPSEIAKVIAALDKIL